MGAYCRVSTGNGSKHQRVGNFIPPELGLAVLGVVKVERGHMERSFLM